MCGFAECGGGELPSSDADDSGSRKSAARRRFVAQLSAIYQQIAPQSAPKRGTLQNRAQIALSDVENSTER